MSLSFPNSTTSWTTQYMARPTELALSLSVEGLNLTSSTICSPDSSSAVMPRTNISSLALSPNVTLSYNRTLVLNHTTHSSDNYTLSKLPMNASDPLTTRYVNRTVTLTTSFANATKPFSGAIPSPSSSRAPNLYTTVVLVPTELTTIYTVTSVYTMFANHTTLMTKWTSTSTVYVDRTTTMSKTCNESVSDKSVAKTRTFTIIPSATSSNAASEIVGHSFPTATVTETTRSSVPTHPSSVLEVTTTSSTVPLFSSGPSTVPSPAISEILRSLRSLFPEQSMPPISEALPSLVPMSLIVSSQPQMVHTGIPPIPFAQTSPSRSSYSSTVSLITAYTSKPPFIEHNRAGALHANLPWLISVVFVVLLFLLS